MLYVKMMKREKKTHAIYDLLIYDLRLLIYNLRLLIYNLRLLIYNC
jgi:hypothetical protein